MEIYNPYIEIPNYSERDRLSKLKKKTIWEYKHDFFQI